jgi:hypothetical protein
MAQDLFAVPRMPAQEDALESFLYRSNPVVEERGA